MGTGQRKGPEWCSDVGTGTVLPGAPKCGSGMGVSEEGREESKDRERRAKAPRCQGTWTRQEEVGREKGWKERGQRKVSEVYTSEPFLGEQFPW